MKTTILLVCLFSLCLFSKIVSAASNFRDSFRGQDFRGNYSGPTYQNLQNSTWRSYKVAEGVSPQSKLWPSYVSNDKNLDLFLFQNNQNSSWVSNVLGASSALKMNNISSSASSGMTLVDFNKDSKEDVLQISADRKSLTINRKSTSFQNVTWTGVPLIDIRNLTDLLPDNADYRISSFVVEDLNNDDLNDIILGVGLTNPVDGTYTKTILIIALQTLPGIQFTFEKVDLDIGSFLLVDIASFESKDSKEILIFLKNQKLALIKNITNQWVYSEITSQPVLTSSQYSEMERFSGIKKHMYIVDYDSDGYLDILLLNQLTNRIEYLNNPGAAYWSRLQQSATQVNSNRQNIIKDWKTFEKWQSVSIINSTDSIIDFTMVNIDSEDKLVFAVLFEDHIELYYPQTSTDQTNKVSTFKQKRLLIDGSQTFKQSLTNIYDADVSNENEVQFIVFSSQNKAIYWIKRDIPVISVKWSSNFWVYIIMYVHIAALLLGLFHFTIVVGGSKQYEGTTSFSQPQLLELASRDAGNSGWNMENIGLGQKQSHEKQVDNSD